MAFESLTRERSGIELLNVRHEDGHTSATVFVPDGKLDHFENLIRDYLAEKRDGAGRPRDNRRLIDAIQRIRMASLHALERYDQAARYALIVVIRTPETEVDLYAEVANRIGAPVAVEA